MGREVMESTDRFTFHGAPLEWQCAIHGPVGSETLRLSLGVPADGHYCLKCYAVWVSQHITKLEPVERRQADNSGPAQGPDPARSNWG